MTAAAGDCFAAAPLSAFREARGNAATVILEGFHAVKHARRFGARFKLVVARDPDGVVDLAKALAPDLTGWLRDTVVPVGAALFDKLVERPVDTGIIALADRPESETTSLVGPCVLLEAPRHQGNIGAVVRVAAAAGAAAVLTTGDQDPWHGNVVRAAAGLHFALPVARVATVPTGRPLVAVDPGGRSLLRTALPLDCTLAFGGERRGLSEVVLAQADEVVAIPMRRGVSSLNLATAVAIALYASGLAPALAENGAVD